MPRGPQRFRAYLDAMTDGHGDLKLPLFNPMGKGHIAALLDRLIGAGAEGPAREELARVAERLSEDALGGAVRVALVVADDAGGGWTDRCLSDEQVRFQGRALRKREWAVAVLWTGDPPHAHGPERIAAATAEAVYRHAYQRRHGEPRRLRDRLLQEGLAVRFGGAPGSRPAPAERARTASVVRGHLDTDRSPPASRASTATMPPAGPVTTRSDSRRGPASRSAPKRWPAPGAIRYARSQPARPRRCRCSAAGPETQAERVPSRPRISPARPSG